MFEQCIEEAALNSWPALQQVLYDGWIVRFANGYTKRANSVTPLYPSRLAPQDKIAYCERLYQQHNMPTIFRLPSFLASSQELDQFLEQQQYQHLDRTLVLTKSLSADDEQKSTLALETLPLSAWFAQFCRFSPVSEARQQLYHALLARITPDPLFAIVRDQERILACGLGVLDQDFFGLFDIIVDPAERNKGHGSQLVRGMLAWAQQQGARHAYLQVEDANQHARHVYAKLGFTEVYHYWYRAQPNAL